jgi:hypothetical protein
VLAAAASSASSARADAASDKAAAEALFSQGKALLEQGNTAEACKSLEASQRLDAGLGTLLYLADCYERAGRLASAWATFREAASIAKGRGDSARASVASERADALEPKLSRLSIQVAGGNPPDLVVERNETAVPRATWGVAVPIDMGTHQIRAHAPGRLDWTGSVTVEDNGMTASIEIPRLAAAAEQPEASEMPARTTPEGAVGADAPPEAGSGQRAAGLVVGGLGVVGVAVGAIFGIDAIGKNDDSLALCDPNDATRCTAEGKQLRDQAGRAALASTVAFGVGGVALATGIVLYVTAPSSDGQAARLEIGTRIEPTGGGRVTLGGRW